MAWMLGPIACIAAGLLFLNDRGAVHLDKGFCVETVRSMDTDQQAIFLFHCRSRIVP
jgi:hypothetical protein